MEKQDNNYAFIDSQIEYLYKNEKLGIVLIPNRDKCSVLLQKAAKEKIDFMDNLRKKLEYIKI